MQLVFGSEFEQHIATGNTLYECIDKIHRHYVDKAREEIRQLRSELAECMDAQEFGDISVVPVMEEINELVDEWLSAISKVRDTDNIVKLEKVLDEYFEEGSFVRHVS